MPGRTPRPPPSSLAARCVEIARYYIPLGFIAFGGPGVHIGLLRRRFVDDLKWLDSTTFADLFALGNALPGPGSTQLAFSIAIIRSGLIPGFFAFFCWALPSAFGMGALAAGVRRIPVSIPPIALNLLTGLIATAVGLIALSAYQLSRTTAKRGIQKALLFLTAATSICYSAPWLYPVLTVGSGFVTLLWETFRVEQRAIRARNALRQKIRGRKDEPIAPDLLEVELATLSREPAAPSPALTKGPDGNLSRGSEVNISRLPTPPPEPERASMRMRRQPSLKSDVSDASTAPPILPPQTPVKTMIILGSIFVTTFAAVLITMLSLQNTEPSPPRALTLFTNLYVAGTIIFGGGPVVIPLLQQVVVTPGWVSTSQFLLGFSVLQGFPGPNFSFSVYLGVLSLPDAPFLGAVVAFIAIFAPGLLLKAALIPVYRKIRDKPAVRSVLLGLNAGATGLIWSAVYRLWIVGALLPDGKTASLDVDGWWLVCAAGGFLATEWLGMQPWMVVMCGAVAGLLHYGVVH